MVLGVPGEQGGRKGFPWGWGMGAEAAQIRVSSFHVGVEETSVRRTHRYFCMCGAHTGWRQRTVVSMRGEGFLSNVGEQQRFGCVIFLERGDPPYILEPSTLTKTLNLNPDQQIPELQEGAGSLYLSDCTGLGRVAWQGLETTGSPAPECSPLRPPEPFPELG